MSIYDEIDITTARRDRQRAQEDYEWALSRWREVGRERDKLKERVAELEAVAEHADFFPYLREMFGRVELLTGPKGPRLRIQHDDPGSDPDEFPISDEFFGWVNGISESIPADPAPAGLAPHLRIPIWRKPAPGLAQRG